MLEQAATLTGREPRPIVRNPIPGPRAQQIIDDDARYIATTTKTSPIVGRAARGVVVLTEDDNLVFDFTSGIGVVNTGHCHPLVVKAIKDQAERLIHFAGTDFYYDVQAQLAKDLNGVVPGAFAKKTFFANSGTEANEAAIKIVRWSTRRPQLFAFARAFHGRTMGSLSLTSSKTVHRERYFPMVAGVHTIPFPNPYRNPFAIDGYEEPERLTNVVLALLEEKLDTEVPPSEVGAFFVEPVQGEGGYIVPPKTFYPQLRKVLDKHGILMVADEVQTGFGRTGRLFAMEHFGVTPPIVTMAKGMGSGMPIGACVYDARLDFGVSGAHSNTYGGNPVAAAASRATLQAIRDEKLVERANTIGAELEEGLKELQESFPKIGDVRGLGLMWAIDFTKDPKARDHDKETRDRVIVETCKRGLMLLPCGKSAIRVIPPLVTTSEQIQSGLDVLRESLQAVYGTR
jgi:4-aminobutyrate aminotransferase